MKQIKKSTEEKREQLKSAVENHIHGVDRVDKILHQQIKELLGDDAEVAAPVTADNEREAAIDLLADILHWTAEKAIEWDWDHGKLFTILLSEARASFNAEIKGEMP